MTNEEFQRIVLEKLGNLEVGQKNLELGQKNLEVRQKNLEVGQKNLEERQSNLELGQEEIKKSLRAVIEQTADLVEFRQEVKKDLADIKFTVSRLEIATADNWGDIARIKSII